MDPVSSTMLEELLSLVSALRTNKLTKILLSAVMAVLYHGCLRISEVAKSGLADHALRDAQVTFDLNSPSRAPKGVGITLLSFKHSKSSQTIKIKPKGAGRHCPVHLLWKWNQVKPSSQYFICDNNGSPITRASIMGHLR